MRHFQFILLFVLFILLISFYIASELMPEEQAKLYEAQQYNGKVVELYQKGEAQKAVPYAEKAFNIRKEILGEKHPDTLSSQNNLASIYKAVGRLDEALPLYEKGYRFLKQVLGEKHPNTLSSLRACSRSFQE
jgi:tetratricopeptide (TPR) repeat protein